MNIELIIGVVIIAIYTVALVFIFIYCLTQFGLSRKYLAYKKANPDGHRSSEDSATLPEDLPYVTVQLPIYNELYVSERLLEAVSLFNYPIDKFEIQVLDDSDDETVEVIAAKVLELTKRGITISHVRRVERKGYKAGALQYGLQFAKGEFIAIFDADFIPEPDFLSKTVPHFDDDKTGLVQTRWSHLNRNYSILTKIQAFALDMHFTIEQLGRYSGGYFMNFNGTAGIWRRTCIEDAGGWNSDTLTEDLDLSYRAQLKGWKFLYLEGVHSPAELPTEMNAFKSQQFRWNKGGAETARKIGWNVLRSDVNWKVKYHAIAHLFNTSNYFWIFLSAVLSIPLLTVKNVYLDIDYFKYASVFLFASIAICYVYYVSTRYNGEKHSNFWVTYLLGLPVFLSMTLGLSLHNTVAVVKGWLGQRTAFIRTPKFNITKMKDIWEDKKYTSARIGFITYMEGLLAIYFVAGTLLGFYYEDYGLVPFHIMAAFGFGAIFFFSVKHAFAIATRRKS